MQEVEPYQECDSWSSRAGCSLDGALLQTAYLKILLSCTLLAALFFSISHPEEEKNKNNNNKKGAVGQMVPGAKRVSRESCRPPPILGRLLLRRTAAPGAPCAADSPARTAPARRLQTTSPSAAGRAPPWRAAAIACWELWSSGSATGRGPARPAPPAASGGSFCPLPPPRQLPPPSPLAPPFLLQLKMAAEVDFGDRELFEQLEEKDGPPPPPRLSFEEEEEGPEKALEELYARLQDREETVRRLRAENILTERQGLLRGGRSGAGRGGRRSCRPFPSGPVLAPALRGLAAAAAVRDSGFSRLPP